MKKNNDLRFSDEMYNDTVGSLVICHYIFCKKKPTLHFLKSRWNTYKRRLLKGDCPINPEQLIVSVREYFRLSNEEIPIAEVRSAFNVLFLPYLDGNLYPIREDAVLPQTAIKASTVTPILWREE